MFHLLKKINNIPEINYGGCGIVAYGLYKHLENINQITQNTKIIFIEEFDYFDEIDVEYIMKGNAKGVGHVMLYHNELYWDSQGTYEDPFECSILHEFESEPLFMEIDKNVDHFMMCSLFGSGWRYTWNNSFNREKYLSKIEKILDIKY